MERLKSLSKPDEDALRKVILEHGNDGTVSEAKV